MKLVLATTVAFFAVLIMGCAEKTEDERLAEFRSSLKYRAYRLASEKTTRLAVVEFNRTADKEVDERSVHGLLGILLLLADKPEYSCMEADIYTALGDGESETDNLALALRTVALHKMDFPVTSNREYEQLKSNLALAEGKTLDEVSIEHK